MKPLEIKAARTRCGYSQAEVAAQLEMKQTTYAAKENGKVKFTDEQKLALAKILNLSPAQMNDFLYDGMLPIGGN